MKLKDPYKLQNKSYSTNPANELYSETDFEISSDKAIQELVEYATGLEEQIKGDYSLDNIQFQFRYNLFSFVRNGLLAFKVRSLRLYKITHFNFKFFCKEVFRMSYSQVKRMIDAAGVVMQLIHAGFTVLPRNISQCEPLKDLTKDELIATWQEIVDNIPEDLLTAKAIDNFLNPPERNEKIETVIKVPPKLFLRILEVAIEQDLSVVELLEKMFQEVPDSTPTSESTITANSDDKVQNEAVNPKSKDDIK